MGPVGRRGPADRRPADEDRGWPAAVGRHHRAVLPLAGRGGSRRPGRPPLEGARRRARGDAHAMAGGKGEGGGGGSGGQMAVKAKEFSFTPNEVTLPAGVIKVTLTNEGRSHHTLLFENVAKFKKLDAMPGAVGSGEVQLSPGTY